MVGGDERPSQERFKELEPWVEGDYICRNAKKDYTPRGSCIVDTMVSSNTKILLPRIQIKEIELLQTVYVIFATHRMILFPETR